MNDLRAMVLAAGIGSRLAPLSDQVPKPLIKIGGKTIMEHILLLLKKHQITNIVSNTHHLAEQIQNKFKNIKDEQEIDLKFIYEEKLSGVAGGIRHCKDFLQQSTSCIIMGDALTDIDLTKLYNEHKKAVEQNNCISTIAMMKVQDTSQFGVIVTKSMLDPEKAETKSANKIVKFQEKPKAEDALSSWANTGVYFFEPRVFDFFPSEEEAPFYDVAGDLFPKLLEQGEYIQAVAVPEETYWADLGTPQQYLASVKDLAQGKINLDSLSYKKEPETNDIKLFGFNEFGSNNQIGKNTQITNCILWDNVHISDNCELENCIISDNSKIEANSKLKNEIIVANNPHSCTQ